MKFFRMISKGVHRDFPGVNRLTLRFSWEDDAKITSGDHLMKRRRWTGSEIQLLQERYPDEGPNQLAEKMHRSADSVSSFAHRCGLRTRRWLGRSEAVMPVPDAVEAACLPDSSP